MSNNLENMIPCPFCGGTKIKYSLKTAGRFERYYHAQFYCNDCHTYGPRVNSEKVEDSYLGRVAVERDDELMQLAKDAWNKRAYNLCIDLAKTNI